jgi:hypothetical protein
MRKLLLIVSVVALGLVACNKKIKPELGDTYAGLPAHEANVAGTATGNRVTANSSSGSLSQAVQNELREVWHYTAQSINLRAHTTIQQAMVEAFPQMQRCYNYDNVGGAKLIGEMSADREGHSRSSFDYPIALNVLSPSQLRYRFITNETNIISRVVDGFARISYAKIVSGTTAFLSLDLTIKSLVDEDMVISFEQGQMVEATDLNVQNIIVASYQEFTLRPHESRQLTIPVYCASHYRAMPTGSNARVTPYVMDAESSVFQSQGSVWQLLEEGVDPNDYITFYIWKSGETAPPGNSSKAGHAFVRIPQVGTFGFGSKNGSLFDDEGEVFEQTNMIRFATDSCSIRLSKETKRIVESKLREMQANVPEYRVGNYDCVSFVMDLADAGGIHYGNRMLIRTPMKFMEELKRHNYFE